MSIVSNFEDYWCAGKTSTSLDDYGQSEAFSPFQYLRDDMIQEIIDMLDKRDLLRSYHFQLILHSNIRRLNLAVCRRLDNDLSILITLGARCQKLTHLKMYLQYAGNLEDVYSKYMCTLFSSLPRLTSLDLGHSPLNAEVVKVISENCSNLLDFNGFRCEFNDTDLLYVCNSPKHPKNLPKLRNLSFHGFPSHIHVDTVVHLLNSHPSLRYLCFPGIGQAFEQMYGEEFQYLNEVPPEWIHNLLEIDICEGPGRKFKLIEDSGGELKPILSEVDRLNLTFQYCPFLTKLSLIGLEEPDILKSVSKLKHLTKLNVDITMNHTGMCMLYQSNIFSTHMLSVLTDIGHNLISLECSGCYGGVSLMKIGKLCPNLEFLKLDEDLFVSEHDLVRDNAINLIPCFTNLKVIKISSEKFEGDTPTFIDEEALWLLLQNATKIIEIELSNVIITDKTISSSNKKHSFRHLKKCHLIECSPITVESVWELLSADNPLTDLIVEDCENITKDDMDLVKHQCKLRQFNISIGEKLPYIF